MIIFVRIESLDYSFRIFHNPALTVRRNNGTWTRFVQETKKIHQKRNNRGAHVRNLRSHTWSWLIRSRATAFLGLLHLSSAPQYIFDSQRCNDGSRSCVAVPRIILPASLSHVWYILSLSLSPLFPGEESGCRITERPLCESHRATAADPWPFQCVPVPIFVH